MDDNEPHQLTELLSSVSGESKKGPPRKGRTNKLHSKENKCLNEKRRREQENIFMEELAELLSTNITDLNSFSSVKPDKCAILEETLNKIRRIRTEEGEHSDAVQQSQVSSSQSAILANDVLGPLLLEALDGFLFVVNSQGKVVFASDNISQLLKYVPDDLMGKSIYNIIHVGDHAQFSSSLLPMSSGNCIPWPSESPSNKSRTFNCRMLIKSTDEKKLEEGGASCSQGSQYESMQITAVLQPCEITDTQTCLVCIARRINQSEKGAGHMLGVEQFTTKQDLSGKILACDTGGVNTQDFSYPEYVGEDINRFCHVNDLQQLQKHHSEVITHGSNTSGVYRFRLYESRYVFVQTKSKLFKNPSTGEPEFIMSTHSIVRECDTDSELKGSASTSLMKSIIGQHAPTKHKEAIKQLGNNKAGTANHINQQSSMMGLSNQSLLGSNQGGNIPSGLSQLLNSTGSNFDNQDSLSDLNIGDLLELLPDSMDSMPSTLTNAGTSSGTKTGYPGNLSATMGMPMGGVGNNNSGGMGAGLTSPNDVTMTQVSWSSMNNNNVNHVMSGLHSSANFVPPNRNAMMVQGQLSPGAASGMRPRLSIPSQQQRLTGGPPSYGPSSLASPGYANQRSPGFSPGPQRSPGPYSAGRMSLPRQNSSSSFAHAQSPVPSPIQALEIMKEQVYDPKLLEQVKQLYKRSSNSRNEQAKLKKLLTTSDAGGSDNMRKHLYSLGIPPSMLPSKSVSTNQKLGSSSGAHYNTNMTPLQSPRSAQPLPSPALPSPALPSPALPSPALSSPQQPQSTSVDDPHPADSTRGAGGGEGQHGAGGGQEARPKEDNKILKQLLNADDNDDDEEAGGEASSTVPERGADESRSNEAEPKTNSNQLLIKLLEEKGGCDKQSPSAKNNALLQQLLRDEPGGLKDEKPDVVTSSVTSSITTSSMTSTSSLPPCTTTTSASSTVAQPPPPETKPDHNLLKLLNGSPMGGGGGILDGHEEFSNLLSKWDKDDSMDSGGRTTPAAEIKRRALKRKFSEPESGVHSTSLSDMLASGPPVTHAPRTRNSSTSSSGATPSEKNVLLAQLLSKNAQNGDAQSSGRNALDVCAVPQNKLPKYDKNMWDKLKQGSGSLEQRSPASSTLEQLGPNSGSLSRANSDGHLNRSLDQRHLTGGGTNNNWDNNPRINPNFAGNQLKDNNHPSNRGLSPQMSLPLGLSGSLINLPSPAAANDKMLPPPGGAAGGGMGLSSQGVPRPSSASSGPLTPGAYRSLGNITSGLVNDPALTQILQEVTQMQNDLNNQGQNHAAGNNNQSMMDDSNLISHLDAVLNDPQISDLEDLLNGLAGSQTAGSGMDTPAAGGGARAPSMSEQMKIEMIQQQLMSDMPGNGNARPCSEAAAFAQQQQQQRHEQLMGGGVGALKGMPPLTSKSSIIPHPAAGPPMASPGMQQGQGGGGGMHDPHLAARLMAAAQRHAAPPPHQHDVMHTASAAMTSQLRQHYHGGGGGGGGAGSDVMAMLEQQQQHFRAGPLPPRYPSISQGARMPALTPGPGHANNMAMQVRHTILLQQQQKRLRQKALQRHQQPGGGAQGMPIPTPNLRMPSPGGQAFPQMPSPGFPDNLNEMMKTTLAPNVSIQRNQQLPGPMGGQFPGNPMMRPGAGGAGGGQPGTPTTPGVGPHSRMSPFGPPHPQGNGPPPPHHGGPQTSPGAGAPQWAQRGMMNGAQNGQYGMRPRHMSPTGGGGGAMGPRFHQLSPEHIRMMQARAAMQHPQGLASPGGNPPLSPYPGSQQDPMLLSPHSQQNLASPASQISPQQMKPGYSPGAASIGSGALSPNFGPQGPGGMGPMQPGAGGFMGPGYSPEARAGPNGTSMSAQDLYGNAPGNMQQKSPGSGSVQSAKSEFVKHKVRGYLTNKNQQQHANQAMGGAAHAQQMGAGPMGAPMSVQQQQQPMGGGGHGNMGGMGPVHGSNQGMITSPHVSPHSASQSMGGPLNQSMNQSMTQSLNQSMGQPMGQSMSQALGQSMGTLSTRPSMTSLSSMDSEGELPMNVLETLDGLFSDSAQHEGLLDSAAPSSTQLQSEDKLRSVREQARGRCQQFKQLASQPGEASLGSEKIAHNLFRSQLLGGGASPVTSEPSRPGDGPFKKPDTPNSVNVVQTEPRVPVDDIRPSNQSNSLLQKLLSDNS